VSTNGTRTFLGLGPVDVVAEYPASSVETLPEAVLAAEAASSTGRDARDEHPVARLEIPYGGPDDVDGSDSLMPEDPAGLVPGYTSAFMAWLLFWRGILRRSLQGQGLDRGPAQFGARFSE
jgi:hypothetical protein